MVRKKKNTDSDTDSHSDSDSDSDSEQSHTQIKIALGIGVGIATLVGALVLESDDGGGPAPAPAPAHDISTGGTSTGAGAGAGGASDPGGGAAAVAPDMHDGVPWSDGQDYGYNNGSDGELDELSDENNDNDCLLIYGQAQCSRSQYMADLLDHGGSDAIKDRMPEIIILKLYVLGTHTNPNNQDFIEAYAQSREGPEGEPQGGSLPHVVKRINGEWDGYQMDTMMPTKEDFVEWVTEN